MNRLDFQCIADFIKPSARILDMGCANGDLLFYLKQQKNTVGIGVDINNDGLTACLSRGITCVYSNIDKDLSLFATQSFDYVILSQTLQNISCSPLWLLTEMLRIGQTAVVSIPNFAFWQHRLHLFRGIAPRGGALPYEWYDTPNTRYCSINDFEKFCNDQGLRINRRIYIDGNKRINKLPNLLATVGLYEITKAAS